MMMTAFENNWPMTALIRLSLPFNTRSKKIYCDKKAYKQRNKIEHFRRIFTRDDKLKKTFFASLCICFLHHSP